MTKPSGLGPVQVANSGSLNAVLDQDILPAFQEQTGYTVVRTGGPAVGLANQLRAGEITPDLYLSADAQVNRLLLAEGDLGLIEWFVTVVGTRMVLAYSPVGRFAADFAAD